MKATIATDRGEILVDTDVIAKYAGTIAVECFGVVGMAATNVFDGIGQILGKENLSQGIEVSLSAKGISLEFHIIVAYGVSISAVSDNLIENVKYRIETFTGLPVEKINVFVEGVKVID